jgi:2',3'-cyclic-nucleotide 2'-phosphodiesterase/3'-nucleotidase
MILVSVFLLILSGCKTTEPNEQVPAHMPDTAAAAEQPKTEMEPAEKIKEPVPVPEAVPESVVEAVEPKDDLVIHIAATGNVQGELFDIDLITGERRNASLTQVFSYLEQVRTEYGGNLLLLDHGNVLTGSFVTSYWNAVKAPEDDHIIASVMNAMGYKAAAAGTRDIGMDTQILSAAAADFDFPVLSANLIYSDSRESVLPSHTIVNMGEVSIAVIGVTGETEVLPEEFELIDALQAVNSTVSSLNADAVIALVSGPMQLSEKIASESRGIDVIIGGDRLASRLNRVNHPVYIIGTQPNAQKAAAAGLVFSWNGDRYELAGVETTMIDISSYQASPAAVEAFAPILEELEQALMTRVGYLSDTIDTRKAQIADSSVVDLIHAMQMKISGADISFASAPVARAPLLEGPVYVRDVLHALSMLGLGERLPSLYVVEMTGEEIDAYLEHSYGMWFGTMSSIDDSLIKGTDFELYDTAAGINYIVDVRAPAGNRVKITTTASGKKFMKEDSYSVVLNEFRANDIGAYLSQGLGLSIQQAQQRIQRVISLDLLRSLRLQEAMLGTLEPSTDENWFASPRIWAQRAAQKEGLEL